jgi:hypothetical protein
MKDKTWDKIIDNQRLVVFLVLGTLFAIGFVLGIYL